MSTMMLVLEEGGASALPGRVRTEFHHQGFVAGLLFSRKGPSFGEVLRACVRR